jgi:hypothetical protein
MIHLIFILFLISGFYQEFTSILKIECHKFFKIFYSIGAIFFLFYKDDYIIHGFIVLLMIMSGFKIATRYENDKWSKLYIKVDPYISFIIILLLGFHYIVWWLK